MNNRAAHNRTFSEFSDGRELLRGRDPEADGHRKLGDAADALDQSLGVYGHLLACAGKARA